MAKQYLDYDGLLYFWQKLKAYFVPQTRKINNKALSADITLTASDVSALPESTTIPSPGTGSSYPTMDGTRALGTNSGYARVDHVHPHDTSRVPTTRKVNGHALSADVNVTASDIGVEAGAEVNDIDTVKVNGTALTITDKAVDVPVPTKTSDLTNDSNFVSDASYVHTDNNFTTTLKDKLDGIAEGATANAGTVTSVRVQATSPVVSSTSTAQSTSLNTTISLANGYGDTKNPYASKDAHMVLASPSESAGAPTFRFLLMGDIPDLQSLYVTNSRVGQQGGVCPLNANTKIDSAYLPSYVDDVVEAYPRSGATELSSSWLSTSSGGAALTPETGVIYILMADSASYSANSQFRWSGTTYVKLADGGVSSITNAEIDTIVAS